MGQNRLAKQPDPIPAKNEWKILKGSSRTKLVPLTQHFDLNHYATYM